MIAHVSIPAKNPKEVALLLGALTSSRVFHFPVVEGAYIVVAEDNSGMAVEVYPAGMTHHPGQGVAPEVSGPPQIKTQPWEDQIYMESAGNPLSSHHMAITTVLSEEEVVALGKQYGFRSLVCDRAGVFKLVEVWIDNTYLVEVLVSKEAERYKSFMNPSAVKAMFGDPILPKQDKVVAER